jgi:geranylgeranyl pyrophosphate synthase
LRPLPESELGGAEGEQVLVEIRPFGECLGMAFQILDDILDVTSTEDLLGKKAGIDIIERKPSAVNVLWLESGSKLAERLLKAPGDGEEEYVEESLAELRSSAVVQEARELARCCARLSITPLTG